MIPKKLFLLAFALLPALCLADGPAPSTATQPADLVAPHRRQEIIKAYPTEWPEFEQEAARGLSKPAAEKLLALLNKAQRRIILDSQDAAQTKRSRLAYWALWTAGDKFYQATSSAEAKKLILDAWNAGLKEPTAATQILSIGEPGNEDFINDQLKAQLLATRDKIFFRSAVTTLIYYGGKKAHEMLDKIIADSDSRWEVSVAETGLIWVIHDEKHDPTDPGPSEIFMPQEDDVDPAPDVVLGFGADAVIQAQDGFQPAHRFKVFNADGSERREEGRVGSDWPTEEKLRTLSAVELKAGNDTKALLGKLVKDSAAPLRVYKDKKEMSYFQFKPEIGGACMGRLIGRHGEGVEKGLPAEVQVVADDEHSEHDMKALAAEIGSVALEDSASIKDMRVLDVWLRRMPLQADVLKMNWTLYHSEMSRGNISCEFHVLESRATLKVTFEYGGTLVQLSGFDELVSDH